MITFGFIILIALIAGIVLGYVAYFRARDLRRDFDEYRRVTAREIIELKKVISNSQASGDATTTDAESLTPAPREERPADPVPTAAPSVDPVRPQTTVPATTAVRKKSRDPGPGGLEDAFASRWLVWMGAVALALGGIFLIKFSIDQGFLGPAVRLTIAAVVGGGFVAGGEWLRRSPIHEKIARDRADYVPPALSAAGLVMLFGSIYAAYGLYGFIGSSIAFIGLAATAFAALLLSLLQGPLIAAIGLLGALLTPLLVTAVDPSVWALLSYVLAVMAAALAVVRYRDWWWLAALSVIGGFLWAAVILVFGLEPQDELAAFLFVLGFIGLPVMLARPRIQQLMGVRIDWRLWRYADGKALLAVIFAVLGGYLLSLLFLDGVDFGVTGLTFLAVLVVAQLLLAKRYEGLAVIAALSVGLILLCMTIWPIDFKTPDIQRLTDGPLNPRFLSPTGLYGMVAAFAALIAGFGFYAAHRSQRPGFWAALSGLAPTVLIAGAYMKHVEGRDLAGWPVSLAVVACLSVMAAQYMRRRNLASALAAYAIAVLSATSVALVFMLEEAWLTVALSLQLPAIAWVYRQIPVASLRPVSLILATLVLARLALNWNIFGYAIADTPIVNWLLYGYGVPALAFYYAARTFRQVADDLLVLVLEGGTAALIVALVSLQIHHWVNDGLLVADYFSLFEVSLQSAAWSAMCLAAFWRERQQARPALSWTRKILFVLTSAQVLLLQVIVLNPVVNREWVGDWPILNVVLLSYGVPAAAAALYGFLARRKGNADLARGCFAAALVLAFITVSLEVRQFFGGAWLVGGRISDAEMYTLSVVWTLFALALLAAGLMFTSRHLRQASFLVILLVVGKVFLVDMSALEGLLRALSFIGLGLSLIGITYFYQRYVLLSAKVDPPPPNTA